MEEEPPIYMEAKMQELEDKMEEVDEKQYNEKKDLFDVLRRIESNVANKARQAHELDQDFIDNQ